jgi:hypothetical protein
MVRKGVWKGRARITVLHAQNLRRGTPIANDRPQARRDAARISVFARLM